MSKLIAFEGPNGSGKSLQAERLYNRFLASDVPAKLFKEPGVNQTHLGTLLDSVLTKNNSLLHDQTKAFIYMAARSDLYRKYIIPDLEKGYNVIVDRSGLSTLVYQGCCGDLLTISIERMNDIANAGRDPDLTLVLDVDVEECKERVLARDGAHRSPYIHIFEKIHECYKHFTKQRYHYETVDGNGNMSEVADRVVAAVDSHFAFDLIGSHDVEEDDSARPSQL